MLVVVIELVPALTTGPGPGVEDEAKNPDFVCETKKLLGDQ